MNTLLENIGLDLGTSNIRLYKNGKIVIEVPPEMEPEGKPADTFIVNGDIYCFSYAESFIRNEIKKIHKPILKIFTTPFSGLISVPSDINEVKLRAYRDMLEHIGAKPAYMLFDSLILAAGLEVDMKDTIYMIVDSGAGKTSITTLRGMEILANDIFTISGNDLDKAIKVYLRKEYGLDIDILHAEKLKIEYIDLRLKAVERTVYIDGLTTETNTPKGVTLRSSELTDCVRNEVTVLVERIMRHFESLDRRTREKLLQSNIHLTGKTFRLKGLIELVAEKIAISQKSYNSNADYMQLGFQKIQLDPSQISNKFML